MPVMNCVIEIMWSDTQSQNIYAFDIYTFLSFFLSFVSVFFMQRILQEFLIRLPFRSLTVVDYCNVVLFYSLYFSSVWRWWNANWCTKFECTSFTWPIYHVKWFWPSDAFEIAEFYGSCVEKYLINIDELK